MSKIVVFSDTHLGYNTPQNGAREQDIYRAFDYVINKIVEIQPDIVIHPGDLFETIRPSNRAICHAINGISRIFKETNTDFVLNSGNHSTPRTSSVIHVFDVIRSSLNQWEKRLFTPTHLGFTIINDKLSIYVIPYCFNATDFELALSELIVANRSYVVVAHGSLKTSSPHPQTDTIVSESFYELIKDSKLTIVGHNHMPSTNGNMLIPGSTEVFGFDEVSDKFFYVIDTDTWQITPYQIPTRPFQDIVIDCTDLDCANIYMEIERYRIVPDAVVRLTLDNVHPEFINSIDKKKIKGYLNDALYYTVRIKPLVIQEQLVQYVGDISESIPDAWDKWSVGQEQSVVIDGKQYIMKALE